MIWKLLAHCEASKLNTDLVDFVIYFEFIFYGLVSYFLYKIGYRYLI